MTVKLINQVPIGIMVVINGNEDTERLVNIRSIGELTLISGLRHGFLTEIFGSGILTPGEKHLRAFVVLGIGAGITLGTWSAAAAGGSYWAMWGLIGSGLFGVIRGLYRKVKSGDILGVRGRWDCC